MNLCLRLFHKTPIYTGLSLLTVHTLSILQIHIIQINIFESNLFRATPSHKIFSKMKTTYTSVLFALLAALARTAPTPVPQETCNVNPHGRSCTVILNGAAGQTLSVNIPNPNFTGVSFSRSPEACRLRRPPVVLL